jgi:hypothetical protein
MYRSQRKQVLAGLLKSLATTTGPATSDIHDNLQDTAHPTGQKFNSEFERLHDLLQRLNAAPRKLYGPELDKLCQKITMLMGDLAEV